MHQETAAIVAELMRQLEQAGVPAGFWLGEIATVRKALQDADHLLLRMERAIEDAATPPVDPAEP